MTLKQGIFILFSFLLLISCSKEIELNFPKYQKQLVVNSIFNTKKPFSFYFSYTNAPLDSLSKINDSIYVTLYEDNYKLLETKFLADSLLTNIYPKSGCSYKLKVYVEGFDTVYACDTLPYLTNLSNGTILQPISIDRNGSKISQAKMTISDPMNKRDYYELIFMGTQYDNSITITDPVLLNEGDIPFNPTSYFFSDELFDGQDYSLVINRDLGFGIKIWVVLRATSRNYYLYRKYLTRHLFTQPTRDLGVGAFIFKGEPQTMYNNIINGYGIFAGFVETSPYLLQQIEK